MFSASHLDTFLDGVIQETQAPQLEEVEVDQRALVNILARYPGQFDGTLFLEFRCCNHADSPHKCSEN